MAFMSQTTVGHLQTVPNQILNRLAGHVLYRLRHVQPSRYSWLYSPSSVTLLAGSGHGKQTKNLCLVDLSRLRNHCMHIYLLLLLHIITHSLIYLPSLWYNAQENNAFAVSSSFYTTDTLQHRMHLQHKQLYHTVF